MPQSYPQRKASQGDAPLLKKDKDSLDFSLSLCYYGLFVVISARQVRQPM